jgi:hypothetical protein
LRPTLCQIRQTVVSLMGPPGSPAGGHSSGWPVGRWFERQGDDPVALVASVQRRPSRPGLVREPRQAGVLVPFPPQEDRHRGYAELGGDPAVRRSLGRAQDDPRALDQPLLRRPRSNKRPEDLEIGLIDRQGAARGGSPWPGS